MRLLKPSINSTSACINPFCLRFRSRPADRYRYHAVTRLFLCVECCLFNQWSPLANPRNEHNLDWYRPPQHNRSPFGDCRTVFIVGLLAQCKNNYGQLIFQTWETRGLALFTPAVFPWENQDVIWKLVSYWAEKHQTLKIVTWWLYTLSIELVLSCSLKAKQVDTIGNCQRQAFTVGVSQNMHKITNLWKFELSRSSNLRDKNERKNTLVTQSYVRLDGWFRDLKF